MRTDSVKKYVIPNIPYLFVLWACLKLGTAYRLAAGADLTHKLMGLGQTVGPAFADLAPGLDPFDWLVGIVGAVGFRLLIYMKSKNAKKFRRDAEYGTARWATKREIQKTYRHVPFQPELWRKGEHLPEQQGLVLGSLGRKNHVTALVDCDDIHCLMIGASGVGKTAFFLYPNLEYACASGMSYLALDTKGGATRS